MLACHLSLVGQAFLSASLLVGPTFLSASLWWDRHSCLSSVHLNGFNETRISLTYPFNGRQEYLPHQTGTSLYWRHSMTGRNPCPTLAGWESFTMLLQPIAGIPLVGCICLFHPRYCGFMVLR